MSTRRDSSQKSPSSGTPRTSQRIPRSCTSCRKRRVKCTQTIPCGPCIAAKQAHLCKREIVMWRGKVAVATDDKSAEQQPDAGILLKENSSLRERIMQLEAELTLGRDALHGTANAEKALDARHGGSTVEDFVDNEKVRADDFETLETTLEKLHGVKPDSSKGIIQAVSTGMIDERYFGTLSLLPTESSSRSIVRFSLSTLGWIHCAVRADLFIQEHDSFWDALKEGDYSVLGNHSWMAVYFAILATGIQYMDHDAALPLLGSMAHPLEPLHVPTYARQWYEHTTEQLYESRFLDEPRLETIQTIAILTLSFRIYDSHEKEWMLLGMAINAARCLKMHRLGSEKSFASSAAECPEWSTVSGRELGRRLWWTLVICDWLGPLTRPPSISPVSFDCLLTIGSTNYNICSDTITDEQTPSPLHHHIVTAKLAYVFYYFVKSDRDRSPRRIFKAVKEIQSTWDRLPPFLRWDPTKTRAYTGQEIWVPFQQYMMVIGFQFSMLMLCRTMFERWLNGDLSEEVTWLHSVAIDAASGIVRHAGEVVPLLFKKSWPISAATVSAGVMLSLDLLCFHRVKSGEQVLHQRSLIQTCLDHLALLPSNRNLQTTVNILRNTLHLHSVSVLPAVQDMVSLQAVMRQLGRDYTPEDISSDQIFQCPAYESSTTTGVPVTGDPGESFWGAESTSTPEIFQSMDLLNPIFPHESPFAPFGLDFSSQWITE